MQAHGQSPRPFGRGLGEGKTVPILTRKRFAAISNDPNGNYNS